MSFTAIMIIVMIFDFPAMSYNSSLSILIDDFYLRKNFSRSQIRKCFEMLGNEENKWFINDYLKCLSC